MTIPSPVPNTYDIGDLVVLTCRFYSDAAMTILANPDTVTLTIKNPVGAIVTPTVPTSSVAGVWTFPYAPLVGGVHEVRWTGTGAVQAAEQSEIFVRKVNTA